LLPSPLPINNKKLLTKICPTRGHNGRRYAIVAFLCQPEIIPGIKYFELPKSRPVVTPSKKESPNEYGTAHWGFAAQSDVLLSLTIRAKQFLVLFSFRVGFFRSADDFW
jgi:hypothetical protein